MEASQSSSSQARCLIRKPPRCLFPSAEIHPSIAEDKDEPGTKAGRPRAKDHIDYRTIRSDSDIPPPLSRHSIVATEVFFFFFFLSFFLSFYFPPAHSDGTPFLGLPSDFPRPGWMKPTTDPKRRRENQARVGDRGGPARSREQPCCCPSPGIQSSLLASLERGGSSSDATHARQTSRPKQSPARALVWSVAMRRGKHELRCFSVVTSNDRQRSCIRVAKLR
jgi:hypothetical protein